MIGIAALVATLGLSSTAGNQIVRSFDEVAATEVLVEPIAPNDLSTQTAASLPWDAVARIQRLNGVVAASDLSLVDAGGAQTTSVPVIDPLGTAGFRLDVYGAAPSLLETIEGELGAGQWFNTVHDSRSHNVAVLGRSAAERLSVNRVDQQPAVFVGEQAFIVIGVLESTLRRRELLDAIIIPSRTAMDRFNLTSPRSVLIRTEIGAAELIGSQAPLALYPNDPALLQVSLPDEPDEVRAEVERQTNALFLLLGALSLFVGALGIANVTLVSVLERTSEIGLRRSLGATRWHVSMQFLLESLALGFFGGILGATVGVLTIVAVSALRDWTPVLDAWLPLVSPLVGATVGLVSGCYPAAKAAGVEPVEALRTGL